MSSDPIFLEVVFEDSTAFKGVALKLTNVRVTVLEDFLSKTIELAVYVISTLKHAELKIILIFWSLNFVIT
jgi:hypothetical protein